jgi:hypothetical protein
MIGRMTAEGPPDISGLIAAWGNGYEEALNHVVPLLFEKGSGPESGTQNGDSG